jgi:hypothetical protein|tara:strand:- start:216 stop:419 length:204 start_codon:yes stop_codon:yes gene_type:complete
MTFMRWHISALILKTLNYENSIRLRYIRIDSNFCDCFMRTQKKPQTMPVHGNKSGGIEHASAKEIAS